MFSDSRSPAIEARGLGKTFALYDRPQDRLKQLFWHGRRRFYREFVAVHDVDLEIDRGECVGVVGRNGSGKSTLLNMICGTLEPSAGEVFVRGRIAPILTIGAGFSPDFTGRENVVFNATMLGLSRAEIADRMQSITDFADIGEFFDQPVKRYSSGMYSRLAFSVAIAIDPEVLVMDEVLAVGDEAFTRKCFARIEAIKQDGATIFFASHAPNLVIELCDRAILMDHGECLLQSDPKTVISQHQRLIHADPEHQEALRDEIRELGVTSECESRREPRKRSVEEPRDFGRFDAGLVPESTVEYGFGGAQIENIRILDREGKAVNVLRGGCEYRYAYQVHFREAARQVRFGMMIKLVTGFELGGQVSHQNGEGLDDVEPSQRVRVEFSFVASLVPGTYFVNAGVLAFIGGEEIYLHRIVDAVMFKILPSEGNRVTGLADLSGSLPPQALMEDCSAN